MSNVVVVAVDGSRSALEAVTWAAQEAGWRKAELRIVHVLSPLHPGSAMAAEIMEQVNTALRSAADLVLEEAARTACSVSAEVQVTGSVLRGPVAATLIDQSIAAQVLVLGARGIGAVSHLLLGSVSTHVVAHAHCPVVVTRSVESSPAARVVLGVDGSGSSEAAVGFAFAQASVRSAELVAVHCVSDLSGPAVDLVLSEDYQEQMKVAGQRLLSEALAGCEEGSTEVSVRHVVQVDHPATALLNAARGAELLVVGSHGRGAFSGMLLGSVSQEVLRRADCPVAVVRSRSRLGRGEVDVSLDGTA